VKQADRGEVRGVRGGEGLFNKVGDTLGFGFAVGVRNGCGGLGRFAGEKELGGGAAAFG
jgi:hypothetical protein